MRYSFDFSRPVSAGSVNRDLNTGKLRLSDKQVSYTLNQLMIILSMKIDL